MKNPAITAERFCRVYMRVYKQGGTAQDVAKILGVPAGRVYTRRYALSQTYRLTFPQLAKAESGAQRVSRSELLAILKGK